MYLNLFNKFPFCGYLDSIQFFTNLKNTMMPYIQNKLYTTLPDFFLNMNF